MTIRNKYEKSNVLRCLNCGKPITQKVSGRARLFDTSACRIEYFRRKKLRIKRNTALVVLSSIEKLDIEKLDFSTLFLVMRDLGYSYNDKRWSRSE